jgi:hypothetical protein
MSELIASLNSVHSQMMVHIRSPRVDPIAQTLVIADALNNLRSLLKDEVVYRIRTLEGKPQGYLVDRKGKQPYTNDEIREVILQAFMQGAYMIYGEVTVIGGNAFLNKPYYRRMVDTWDSVTDVEFSTTGTFKFTEGIVYVPASISWSQGGKKQIIERLGDKAIALRRHESTGVDAYIGKAEKRMLKLALHRISDYRLGGDMDEENMEEGQSRTVNPATDEFQESVKLLDVIKNAATSAVVQSLIATLRSRPFSDKVKYVVLSFIVRRIMVMEKVGIAYVFKHILQRPTEGEEYELISGMVLGDNNYEDSYSTYLRNSMDKFSSRKAP